MKAPPRWAAPVRWLPSPILQPRSAWRSVLVGWLMAMIPSLVIGAAVLRFLPHLGQPQMPLDNVLNLFLVAAFAPAVETLIMAAALSLLLLLLPPTAAVLVSAAGWGIAHSLMAPAWGLVIWWPFLVFSTLFVTWRSRSFASGYFVAASVHALQNTLPALAAFVSSR